jgi:glycosyltransferase involved in cell wall biosynthesis
MPEPLISVIIPAYNAERYLPEAIDSVLGQTCPAGEIIVVDDGSSDGTPRVAERYGSRVRWLSQTNQGSAAARNRGIEAARGELLAFLDADDLWVREKLAWQVEALAAEPRPEMVFGMVQQFVSPEIPEESKQRLACSPEPMAGHVAGAMLARRGVFERAGGFDTRLKMGEFIEWYMRVMDLGLTSVLLPQVVLHRRLHETNMGIRERDSRQDYVRIVKAALDRRAQARAEASPGSGEG